VNQWILYKGTCYSLDEFIRCFEAENSMAGASADVLRSWLENQDSFTLSTSGSTGQPSLITFSRKQLEYSALQTINFFGLTAGDTLFLCLPVKKVAGFMMLIRALTGKMNIVMSEPSALPEIPAREEIHIDLAAFIPFQLQNLIQSKPEMIEKLKGCKGVIAGGNAVNSFQEKLFENMPFTVYETYGMTETLTHIALRKLNHPGKQAFFTLLPEVEISLNEENCLMIRSTVTNNKWLETNDIAEILSKKSFIIKGRKDFVINSGGIKINPEFIEQKIFGVLHVLTGGKTFYVTGKRDEKYGEKICLVIESDEPEGELKEKIINTCNDLLEKHEKIKEIICQNEISRTETGKIIRKKIL